MFETSVFFMSLIRNVLFSNSVPKGESDLGYVILAIIASPVIFLLLTFFLGRPRSFRVTMIFLGFLMVVFCGFIAATYLLGLLLSIFF